MKLSDILDLDFCLFNPEISYSGSIIFNKENIFDISEDILKLNANSNGNNKYEEFLNKYYFKPLDELLHSKSLAIRIPPVIVIEENEFGRITKFSEDFFIMRLINSLILTSLRNIEIDDYTKMPLDEKIYYLRKSFRDERKLIEDVKRNGKNSIYYNSLYSMYESDTSKNKISFNKFIDMQIFINEKIMIASRYFKSIFNKPLNVKELVECFTFDKFALITCKICVDDLIQLHEISNKVSNSVYYLHYYFQAIDYIRQINPKYNCKIKYSENGIIKIIDIDELKTKYEEILKHHPEFVFTTLTSIKDFVKEHGLMEEEIAQMNKQELSNLLRSLFLQDQLKETDKKEIVDKISEIQTLSENASSEVEKNRLILQKEKMEFLLGNKPIKIIKGEGTFSNYYGYIYDNGYVVFDVLDKNVSKSYGNALYIMPFSKIKEYSNKKKMELRNDIFEDVTVILHRGDWKQKIIDKLKEVINVGNSISLEKSNIDISNITSLEELDKIKEQILLLDSQTKRELEESKRKTKALEMIDSEIKESECLDIISSSERSDLNNEIDSLLELNEHDFERLYMIWKQKQNKKLIKRNPVVAAITKLRARDDNGNYCCELCNSKAFDSRDFDAHHIMPIGLGGIDNIYNTICLCPNCHRLMHTGRITLNQQYYLLQKLKNHLTKTNPEYLEQFNNLFSPNSMNDEDYLERKSEIDKNFAIEWNGFKR